jgi:hypothetical protein
MIQNPFSLKGMKMNCTTIKLDRPETGTIFLLTDRGPNVVRWLSSEQDHEIDMNKSSD